MPRTRQEVVSWVGSHILPHEAGVRRWLRRSLGLREDLDDVLQEAYCRIASLDSIDHIRNGRAYLYETARNIAAEYARRARIVRIESVADSDLWGVTDESAGPERIVAGRGQLQLVEALIQALPKKCREVFILRRVHGVSQKEIAKRLRISESTVEMHTGRGIRLIHAALEGNNVAHEKHSPAEENHERARHRRRD